jgi:hypothetical protein
MPKLPTRSRPTGRRHRLAHTGKTLVRYWPLIRLFRSTVGFARLGPLAFPALLGAGVWKLLRRRKRKAQEAAMPSADPFVAPAPSVPSRAFTPNGSGDSPAPDPSAPAPGDSGQETGTLPESGDDAPPRPASDAAPKPDRAAPDARSAAPPSAPSA